MDAGRASAKAWGPGGPHVFEDLAEIRVWGGGRDWPHRASKATAKSMDVILKAKQCHQEV